MTEGLLGWRRVSPVDVAVMPNSHNYNDKALRLYEIEDAIIPHPDTVQVPRILQLFRSWRVGVISKRQNALVDLFQDLLGERLQGGPCSESYLDPVSAAVI